MTQKEWARRHYEANRELYKARAVIWAAKHKLRRKAIKKKNHIKTQFDITPEQYATLLASQQGRCGNPGCDQTPGPGGYWHLDHSHETEAVRGFLCIGCNTALGQLKENEARIVGLIQYLKDTPASKVLAN